MKSFIINILLLLAICSCDNKSTSETKNAVKESSSVSLKILNKKVGNVLPVEDATESDFKIKEAKITGIFENLSAAGYEIRLWTAPKRDITVFCSQWQKHWGDTDKGILPKYDIANYYIYIKFLTKDNKLIACEMFAPYSNLGDYITEKRTSPKFYTKKEQIHSVGEWCNREGTLIHLHIDEERLITRLHHIEVTTKEFYKNWLKQQ